MKHQEWIHLFSASTPPPPPHSSPWRRSKHDTRQQSIPLPGGLVQSFSLLLLPLSTPFPMPRLRKEKKLLRALRKKGPKDRPSPEMSQGVPKAALLCYNPISAWRTNKEEKALVILPFPFFIIIFYSPFFPFPLSYLFSCLGRAGGRTDCSLFSLGWILWMRWLWKKEEKEEGTNIMPICSLLLLLQN